MKRIIAILILAVCCNPARLLADPQSGFDEGLRLYRSDDVPGAIAAWEGVLQSNAVSGSLLYNLGNAYYRQGRICKAILFYERALKLMPRDRDAETNLDLAHLATTDRIEKPVRLMVWNWIDSIRDYFSLRELAIIFGIAGLFSGGLILIYRIGPMAYRATLRSLALAVFICFVIIGSWYIWRAALDGRTFAIIMVDKTDVRSAPDSGSQLLFALHEGTKVRCGENLSGWISIRLTDGRKGWLRDEDLEKI